MAVDFNRNLSEFNNCVLLIGNSQAKILFENKDLQAKPVEGSGGRDYSVTTVLQNRAHPSHQKFFDFARYARIENSFVLSVSHLHSHSSWNTDCVCSAGIPVVSIL